MTTLLVDGDIVVYRAGFAADQTMYEVYVGEDHATPAFSSTSMKDVKKWLIGNDVQEYEISRSPAQKDISASLAGARDILYGLYEKFKPTAMVVYVDGKGNFRHDIATYAKYKGNRDDMRRPNHFNEIRNYLCKHHGAYLVDDQETDDALGIAQGESSIICSIDKDLKQIPGKHYNWVRDELTHVTFDQAERTLYKQVLTGDKSDNIIGIHGVGDKTAEKILGDNPEHFWPNIVTAYYSRFLHKMPDDMEYDGNCLVYNHWNTGNVVRKTPEEYAEEVANLVFIRRKGQTEWQKPLTTQ